ncbi:hypothetical protein AVEN_274836-1 [Araneus ventricosus]|uniref:Secreted protein n=1 Tax=Araneus ventricosus TaxID=182803 RepID=A0A4Y2IAG7_ARAVE|nr:hypothetical protein AVEN_274836-1 [Araneus ventricosus]
MSTAMQLPWMVSAGTMSIALLWMEHSSSVYCNQKCYRDLSPVSQRTELIKSVIIHSLGGYNTCSLRSPTPKNHVVILFGSIRDHSSLRSLAIQLWVSASNRKL